MFFIKILLALLASLLGIPSAPAPAPPAPTLPAPTITDLRYSTMAIEKGSSYDGIVVDLRVGEFTDATSCLVSIHRTDGTDATRECGPDSLAHINSTAGTAKSWTVPFNVLGSGSSGWYSATTGTWSPATVPTGVTVVITTTAHGDITATVSDALNTRNGEYASIAPQLPDTTAPTATLTLTGGKVVNGTRYVRPGDTIKYTVVASDEGSGLDRASNIVFKLAENRRTQQGVVCGSWHNGKFPSGSDTLTGSYTMTGCNGGTAPADGPYGFAVRVYDNAGNNNRIPNEVYVVDGTKPVVSDFNVANILASNSLNVAFQATDATSGVALARVYLAEAQNGVCKNNYSALAGYQFELAPQASGEYAASIDTSALNGEYCVLVSARDNAMNNSTPLFTKVTIDNGAPALRVVDAEAKKLLTQSSSITVEATDPSGIREMQANVYALDVNGRPVGDPVVRTSFTYDRSNVQNLIQLEVPLVGLPDGDYELRYYGLDTLRNRSDHHKHYFTVDSTPPSDFAVISPANGETVKGVVVVKVQVSDPSDITKLLLNVGGKAHSWTNGKSSTITREGDIFSVTVDTTILADGETFVVLRATDGAGNTRYWNNNARIRQHSFIIDNSGPASDLRVEVLEDGTVIVSGDAVDPSGFNRAYVQLVHREASARAGGTIIHLLGQGTNVTWSRTYAAGELADGTYAAHVALVDALGNVSNYGWTDNFVVQTAVAVPTGEPDEEEAPVTEEETES